MSKTEAEIRAIPFAENLLGYIEQRGEEMPKAGRKNFLSQEYIWMKGYIQALKDYKIENYRKCKELLVDLHSICKHTNVK